MSRKIPEAYTWRFTDGHCPPLRDIDAQRTNELSGIRRANSDASPCKEYANPQRSAFDRPQIYAFVSHKKFRFLGTAFRFWKAVCPFCFSAFFRIQTPLFPHSLWKTLWKLCKTRCFSPAFAVVACGKLPPLHKATFPERKRPFRFRPLFSKALLFADCVTQPLLQSASVCVILYLYPHGRCVQ